MQPGVKKKYEWKKIGGLLFCISILFLGAVCCGYTGNVTAGPGPLPCRGNNTAPVAGEQALALAMTGPYNDAITICMLRTSDGVLLRHFDLGVRGTIVGHGGGQLYIIKMSGSQRAPSALCAVRIADGTTIWCQPQVTLVDSIYLANGNVYVLSTSPDTLAVHISHLTVLSERDGRVLWTFQAHFSSNASEKAFITFSQGIIYLSTPPDISSSNPADGTTTVLALRANNGKQLWHRTIPALVTDGLVADEHTVYLLAGLTSYASGTTPAIFAFTLGGQYIKPVTLPDLQTASAVSQFFIAHNMLFIDAAYATNDSLLALSLGDNHVLWKVQTSRPINSIQAWGDHLYTIDTQGEVDTWNLSGGQHSWSYANNAASDVYSSTLRNLNTNTLLIGSGALYMNLPTGGYNALYPSLLALRPRDGSVLWGDAACTTASEIVSASTPAEAMSTPSTPTASRTAGQGMKQHCYWMPSNGRFIQLLQLVD